MHRCTKHGAILCAFCLKQSMIFPIEHVLWDKAPLLSSITRALGL